MRAFPKKHAFNSRNSRYLCIIQFQSRPADFASDGSDAEAQYSIARALCASRADPKIYARVEIKGLTEIKGNRKREKEVETSKAGARSEDPGRAWKSARLRCGGGLARIDCSTPLKIMDRLSGLPPPPPPYVYDSGRLGLHRVDGIAAAEAPRDCSAKAYPSLSRRLIVHDGATLSVGRYLLPFVTGYGRLSATVLLAGE